MPDSMGRPTFEIGIGLEHAGVALGEGGQVLVDEFYQTNVEHIYAIGDVTDRVQLTPVAIEEGMCIANNLFTDAPKRSLSYDNIPTAVFSHANWKTWLRSATLSMPCPKASHDPAGPHHGATCTRWPVARSARMMRGGLINIIQRRSPPVLRPAMDCSAEGQ